MDPWPGTGPGHDLLGNIGGLTVIELGCGNGDNAAALAAAGATVTGIDHHPTKIEQAKQRWHHQPRLHFEHTDATTYLASLPTPVDIACSIFGAFSFTPASPLLDHLTPALAPSGQLAIAARTPPHPTQAAQRLTAWAPYARTINSWTHLLTAHGLPVTASHLITHRTIPPIHHAQSSSPDHQDGETRSLPDLDVAERRERGRSEAVACFVDRPPFRRCHHRAPPATYTRM